MLETELASTVPLVLRSVVEVRGDRDAVVTIDEAISYAELDKRSAKMARALLATGAGKGTRIALMAPDGIFWITTLIAALRIGALVSVVSTLCRPPELAYILRNSDVQVLICARRFLRHNYDQILMDALPGLESQNARNIALAEAPFLRSVWFDDAEGLNFAGSIAELLAHADVPGVPDQALLEAVEGQVSPSDDAIVMYTSGTTSFPKAVVHRQWTIARQPQALRDYFLIGEDDRLMPMLPAFWVGGLSMALMVLSKGATLVYPLSPATDTALDALQRLDVTRVNSWGPLHGKLVAAARDFGIDVDRIGGLATPRDKLGNEIPPGRLANLLGMTETFSAHSGEPFDVCLEVEKAGSSGRAINDMERRVVDPETGQAVPEGEIGELQVRGRQMMSGFYKMMPWDVFTADGFYPTGDLVRIDKEGHLFFVSRRSDVIKTAGANVSRLEVEAALRTLPGVDLPIVVGIGDDVLGQDVVAAVVLKDGAELNEVQLRAELKERISSYKVPRSFVLIDPEDVCWTPSSKVNLPAMKKIIEERLERTSLAER